MDLNNEFLFMFSTHLEVLITKKEISRLLEEDSNRGKMHRPSDGFIVDHTISVKLHGGVRFLV